MPLRSIHPVPGPFPWECNTEAGTALWSRMSANRTAVHFNNRTTDGQTQPDARDRRLFMSAGKLIKDSLFLTRWDPGTIIPHL